MVAGRQTHRLVDRNTLHPYRGGVMIYYVSSGGVKPYYTHSVTVTELTVSQASSNVTGSAVAVCCFESTADITTGSSSQAAR